MRPSPLRFRRLFRAPEGGERQRAYLWGFVSFSASKDRPKGGMLPKEKIYILSQIRNSEGIQNGKIYGGGDAL
jgi:hypothetical protein